METLKQLAEERGDLVRGLQTLAQLVEKEGREYTAEETQRYETDMARQKELETKITNIKRSNDVKDLIKGEPADYHAPVVAARTLEKQNLAFRGWILNGNQRGDLITAQHRQAAYDLGLNLDSPQFNLNIQRSQTIGVLADGGYLRTPSSFSGLERYLKYFSGIGGVARMLPSANGNPSFWAVNDDTSNTGDAMNELDTFTNTAFALSKIDFNYYKTGSGVFPVSDELATDSEIPVDQLISDLIGERIARKLNVHFTTGNLTNSKGFVTEATSALTSASPTAITIEELIDLKNSVDWAYVQDPSTAWYMNQTTYGTLLKLQDGEGRPLLMPTYNSGDVGQLLGHKIVICSAMDNITAVKKPIAFGPSSQFMVRMVQTVNFKKLVELYADQDATGYVASVRVSSRLLNPTAIKYITTAA